MGPNEIAVLAGLLASAIISIAKLVKAYDDMAPIWKVLPAIIAPVLTVGFAAHWQIDGKILWQMLVGVLSALGTYGAIGRPLKKSINANGAT